MIGALSLSWLPRTVESFSARELVSVAKELNPTATIVVHGCFPFSSSFYTRGAAKRLDDKAAFAEAIEQPGTMLLVGEKEAQQMRTDNRLQELARNEKGALFEVRKPMISNH